MYDKLKIFIKNNKEEFDAFEPSEQLWTKIEKNMNTAAPTNLADSKWISWLKYIGLSIPVIVAIAYVLYKTNNSEANHSHSPVSNCEIATKMKENAVGVPVDELKINQSEDLDVSVKQTTAINNMYDSVTLIQPSIKNANSDFEKLQTEQASISNILYQPIVTKPKNNSPVIGIVTAKKDKNNFIIDTLFLGIKKLVVDVSVFDINIKPGEADKIALHAEMHSETKGLFLSKMDCKIKYEVKDSVLHVYSENNKGYTSVGFGSVKLDAFLNFTIPPAIDVILNNNSGNINIDGLKGKVCDVNAKYGNIGIINTNSTITLESSSGNSSLSNIKGNVKIYSSHGNQTLQEVEGKIDLKNNSGDIYLSNIKGDIILDSKYGNQKIEGITGKIDLKNTSGDVSIKESKGDIHSFLIYGDCKFEKIDGNIDAKSSSGDVDIKMLAGDISIDAKYGHVKIVDSRGNMLIRSQSGDITGKDVEILDKADISATYGDIRMSFKNAVNDLSFDLKADLGDLSINKNGVKMIAENGKLFLSKGKIIIKAHTINGDQLYE